MEDANAMDVDAIETIPASRTFSSDGLKLPFDVLHELVSHTNHSHWLWAQRSDLLALMCTCRTLYRSCVPELLSREVCLGRSLRKISSFCRFVLREERRALYIRRLWIRPINTPSDAPLPEQVVRVFGALAKILLRAKNVEALTVDEAENFLSYSPRLGVALASFSKLTELHLTGIGRQTQDAVIKMLSPVTTLELWYSLDEAFEEEAVIVTPDPALLAQNFRATLERLTATCHFNEIVATPDLFFPKVRYLSLTTGSMQSQLTQLMDAFPNISELVWEDTRAENLLDDFDFDDLRIDHDFNSQFTVNRWSALDTISANIVACYYAAIQTHVRTWRLGYLDTSLTPYFHTMMELLQPSNIVLRIPAVVLESENALALFQGFTTKRVNMTVKFHDSAEIATVMVSRLTLNKSFLC